MNSVISLKMFFREQTWQAEKKEALDAVCEKITRLQRENEKSEHRLFVICLG